ncbi:MAG: helix-turn-helix domain-containing protein [Oscillospiraceae bacterium]
MKKRGLTMRALGEALGIPYTTVQGWLSAGKFPRPETYDRVMQWLDNSEDQTLTKDENA